jgi:hypothetical protein
VAQVVEHLPRKPSKCEALSLNSSMAKKRKKERKKENIPRSKTAH